MSIGMIMFHVLLFNNVSAPIRSLHRIYDEVNDAMIYSESFFKILEADQEIEPSGQQKPQVTGKFELHWGEFLLSEWPSCPERYSRWKFVRIRSPLWSAYPVRENLP